MMVAITGKRGNAIYIDLKEAGGEELYQVLDTYRFHKRATWKQLVIQGMALAMLQDNYDKTATGIVLNYFDKIDS